MKKIIIFLVIALITALGVGIGMAKASTINVPGDYSTIQEAIDAAVDDDIIDVAAGTYTATSLASIVIDKPLTLQGAGMDNTIIDAGTFTGTSSCPAWNKGPRGIQVISDDVFIKDLTVQGFKGDDGATCGGYGILFRDIDDDSAFSGGGVENVKVKDCHEGIYALRFEDLVIKDNIVENSVGDGMFIARDSANAVIEENTVTNSGDQGIWVGTDWMAQEPSDNCQIKNNVVNGTREAGIIFAGSVDCLIEGNSVTNSQGEGWSFGAISIKDGSDDVTVTQNTVHNNPTLGIGIDGASGDILIEYNKIYENTGYGVQSLSSAVNAENNWWGDATGPYHATTNPSATGDAVSDNVNFRPWYSTSAMDETRSYNVFIGSIGYLSIQAAIDAATTSDTINVAAGTYTPTSTIIVNKDNLNLVGPQANVDPRPSYDSTRTAGSESEAVIDGSASGLGMIIEVDADNVVINGFEIKSGTGDMIKQDNPHSGTTVKYSIIHDGRGDEGVQLKKCTGGILEYNYVYDIASPGDALNISDGSSDGKIRYNECYDIGSENAAIYVYDSTNMEILGNLVYQVTQNDGIKLGDKDGDDASKTGGLIKDNVVYDTEQDGITVYMSGVTIEGNEVYNSRSENGAIYLAYAISNIDIRGNSVHDNVFKTSKRLTTAGILLENRVDATSVTVNFNNIYNNTPYGVTNEATAETLDTTNNWWGNATGPKQAATNSCASGDEVSENVNYTPWFDAVYLSGSQRDHNVENVTEDIPYNCIQEAIDNATTSDTINVAAGTYDEYVDIDKPLTLSGQSGAIVKPSTSPDEPIIGINADGVTVEGFEVDGMGLTVVWAGIGTWDGCTNVTIQDNIVHDILNDPAGNANSGLGIGLWRGGDGNIFEDILIEGNTIYNTDRMGIYIGALNSGYTQWLLSDNIIIRDNEVYDTMLNPNVGETFPGGCGGIAIDATKGSTVEGNTVYDTANTMPGIFLAHGSGPRNQISGNEVHDQAYGIAVDINRGDVDFGEDSPTAPEVHSNNIHDNGEYGLIVLNADEKVVDATNNWWGDEAGPGGEGPGDGDQISERIDYSPWYANQEMTSLAGTLVDNQLTLSTEVNINVTTTIGNVTVEIPAGLTVTGEEGWNGEINAPEVKEISSVTVIPESGTTVSVSAVIEIGYGDIKLTFDQAVRIAIAGQAGKYAGYSRAGVFTPITTTCTADTQAAGNALPAEGDCKRDVGSDLVIWTKHFTKFVTYSQTTVPPSGGAIVIFTGDTTAPSISEINVVAGSNAAIVTWQTNEQSISWLVYGETTTYGEEVKTTTYVTSHSVTLENLNPSTTYHYQIKSKDSSGNIGTHTDRIFTTSALEEEITGDINDDGKVDIFDFNLLMVNWGDSPANLSADLDDNGRVDISDFNLLIVNWTK